ncbi:MAG TPA: DUF58 domain-containing protein [Gemmatimonadales bacterium]|nr:DUF58 domain-containing protein [Gemmatimonadales bacterium]
MNDVEVLEEVRRLEITTRHLVRDILAGQYLSVFHGRGVEFSEVREYQPGDDVRSIDWNVTARLGTAYVKRYIEERALTVMFLVDLSASRHFGTRRRTKGDLATELCAVLALAAARNHDRTGALFFTDRVERYIAPRQGRRQALRLVSDLLTFAPQGTGTDLSAALEFLEPTLRRRTVLFILSDFLTEGYETGLTLAARRHDVIPLQLIDPRERELVPAGLVTLWDEESGRWQPVDTDSPAVREHFRARMEQVDGSLEQLLQARGLDLVRLRTDASFAEPLIAFFRRRERRRAHG